MTARIFAKLIATVAAVLIVAMCTVGFVIPNAVEETYISILKSELDTVAESARARARARMRRSCARIGGALAPSP